jgi:hypothetical protein
MTGLHTPQAPQQRRLGSPSLAGPILLPLSHSWLPSRPWCSISQPEKICLPHRHCRSGAVRLLPWASPSCWSQILHWKLLSFSEVGRSSGPARLLFALAGYLKGFSCVEGILWQKNRFGLSSAIHSSCVEVRDIYLSAPSYLAPSQTLDQLGQLRDSTSYHPDWLQFVLCLCSNLAPFKKSVGLLQNLLAYPFAFLIHGSHS